MDQIVIIRFWRESGLSSASRNDSEAIQEYKFIFRCCIKYIY